MEHKLEYKLHVPANGPRQGQHLYFVECACRRGSPYAEKTHQLDRWIVSHLTGAGLISSKIPEGEEL